jgi:hypothetical protein
VTDFELDDRLADSDLTRPLQGELLKVFWKILLDCLSARYSLERQSSRKTNRKERAMESHELVTLILMLSPGLLLSILVMALFALGG